LLRIAHPILDPYDDRSEISKALDNKESSTYIVKNEIE